MIDQQPALQPNGSARRKLLRGAFAAPAVLTVHSGSALAAASMNGCLVKSNSAPVSGSVINVSSSDDALVRVQLWGPTSGSTVSSYWIRGSDLSALQRKGQVPFLSTNQFQRFDIATNKLVTSTGVSPTATTPSKWGSTFKATPKWAVLRIDTNGAVVSAGAAGAGAPAGDSCWNSFTLANGG